MDSPRTTDDSPAGDHEPAPPKHRWSAVDALLSIVRLGPVVVLVVLAIVMSVIQPLFATTINIQNLLQQSAVIAIIGIGQLLVILTRGIDLSVGSVIGFSSAIGGIVFGATSGSVVTMVAMLAAGAGVGLINGLLFVKGRIPHPFIVTLATLSVVRGLGLYISDGQSYAEVPDFVVTLGQGQIGPVPVPAIVVAIVAVLAYLLTQRTQWGRWIYAVGGNPSGAEQVGIPVSKVLISVYAISGLTAGVGALIVMGRTASGDPTAGNLAELDAIAAVIIGGASFFGGRGSVLNVLVGALTIGVIRNGLDLMGVSSFLQLIVIGLVVLIAVELDVMRVSLEAKLRTMRAAEGRAS